MAKLHIKKDDTVVVIAGNSKNSTGKVIAVSPSEGKVIVEGVAMVSKHKKARKQGDVSGIIKTPGAIYASKVMLYCPTCKAGRRTKAAFVDDKDGNKKKIRVCVKCGKEI